MGEWGNLKNRSFSITGGVQQRCDFSPRLFSAVPERALRQWRTEIGNAGFDLGDALDNLVDLRFADDIFFSSRLFAAIRSQGAVLLVSFQALELLLYWPVYRCAKSKRQSPNIKSTHKSGWMEGEATGVCGVWWELCEEVTKGGGSPSRLWWWVGSSKRRLAGNAVNAAWVRKAVHLEMREAVAAWRKGAGRRRLPHSNGLPLRFLGPPNGTGNFEGVQGKPVLGFAGIMGCTAGFTRAGERRDYKVVSTANWAPPQSAKPLAMTSMRRSSMWWTCWTLRSASRVWVVTRAPASRHTLAAVRSSGPPRLRSAPDWAQAARWSPRESKVRRHRQVRANSGRGSRSRRRSRIRKRWDG